jgi:hypothetical protein
MSSAQDEVVICSNSVLRQGRSPTCVKSHFCCRNSSRRNGPAREDSGSSSAGQSSNNCAWRVSSAVQKQQLTDILLPEFRLSVGKWLQSYHPAFSGWTPQAQLPACCLFLPRWKRLHAIACSSLLPHNDATACGCWDVWVPTPVLAGGPVIQILRTAALIHAKAHMNVHSLPGHQMPEQVDEEAQCTHTSSATRV